MRIFFDADDRPFLLDERFHWVFGPNAYLSHISVIDGSTASPNTWRSHAYDIGDFMTFAEHKHFRWQDAIEWDLAEFRNLLATKVSPHTHRPLQRATINRKIDIVCGFYVFAQRKGWIGALPFEVEQPSPGPYYGHRWKHGKAPWSSLKLKGGNEAREIVLPTREDTRRFLAGFGRRDNLMAELKWLAGLRRSEVCELPLVAIQNAITGMKADPVPVEILGKGRKLRTVYISQRTLLGIDGYIRTESNEILRKNGVDCDKVFVGRTGEELDPSAMNAAYDRNVAETGIKIHAHLLRHSFATERLEYLLAQGFESSQALLILQQELGHAHLSTTNRYLHLSNPLKHRAMLANNSFVDQQLGQTKP